MQHRSLATQLILVLAVGLTCRTIAESAELRRGRAYRYRIGTCKTLTESTGSQPASPTVPVLASAPVAKQAEGKCLDCHGPFDKLIVAPTKYIAPSGEKISPHRYVPHDSKLAKDIPDCCNCHTAHPLSPLPAKGAIDLSKLSVQWCYSCHHENNFTSCKECHP